MDIMKQKRTFGRRGDFYTSVSTGELFGQLLAFQFAEWLEELRNADRGLRIVEAGAHDGKLAGDILRLAANSPPETIFRNRIQHPRTFAAPAGMAARNVETILPTSAGLHDSTIQRFNDSTESFSATNLLDALPVHRFGWDAKNKKWFEWGVAVEGEKFIWAKTRNDSEFRIPNSELESVLPDGYTIETSPAAENWWREAAGILAHGKLLAIDYGFTADEMFSPARTHGTLRAYFRHRPADDLLANVGEQDLTAHVNFSAIQKNGEGRIENGRLLHPAAIPHADFGKAR